MSPEATHPELTRVPTACRFCRHSKLKCSGTLPCDRCHKRSRECIYDLKEGVESRQARPGPTKRQRLHYASNTSSAVGLAPLTSPRSVSRPAGSHLISNSNSARQDLARSEEISPQFLENKPDKGKRWLYLGASSTWSFNIRVATLLRSHLKDDPNNKYEGFTLDGEVHTFSFRQPSPDNSLDFSRLPSLDYAIYLINTIKFHLGGMIQVFDEPSFLELLQEFYDRGPERAHTNRLWYAQFLLLLALGKGFLNARQAADNSSSLDLFLRAMSILPNTIVLHDEPVLAAEVFVAISLYFYCLDMKNCAYSYIGQAMRLALVEGMHADLPEEQLGAKFSARCRNLWWTTYILDRTLSSAVGAPVSVHDRLIRQPLASARDLSQRDATLIMHVKLCRVVSYILNELYTANENLGQSYLSKTRSVLLHMADIAQELEETIEYKFKTSFETLSKGALYLRMLYNQCIILATRPLLICLLQDLLKSLSAKTGTRVEIPSLLHELLQTCVTSATKTLKMLDSLHDHNLLDTFLPFDLEFACSASSALIMVDEVLRTHKVNTSIKSLISTVLDKMVQGGNTTAPSRQAELQHVSQLAARLWEPIDASEVRPSESHHRPSLDSSVENSQPAEPARTLTNSSNNSNNSNHTNNRNTSTERQDIVPESEPARENDDNTSPSIPPPPPTRMSPADFAQTFDFSQDQILFLADHLTDDSVPLVLDFRSHGLDEWI